MRGDAGYVPCQCVGIFTYPQVWHESISAYGLTHAPPQTTKGADSKPYISGFNPTGEREVRNLSKKSRAYITGFGLARRAYIEAFKWTISYDPGGS